MWYRDKNGKQDAFVDLVFKINLFMYYCIYFCVSLLFSQQRHLFRFHASGLDPGTLVRL